MSRASRILLVSYLVTQDLNPIEIATIIDCYSLTTSTVLFLSYPFLFLSRLSK